MTGKEKQILEIEFYRHLRAYTSHGTPETSCTFWTVYDLIKDLYPGFEHIVTVEELNGTRYIKLSNRYKDDEQLIKINR